MMVRIFLPVRPHIACAERLPRKLQCSRCRSSRNVGPEHSKAIVSKCSLSRVVAGRREQPH
jgi:hypothetical protein